MKRAATGLLLYTSIHINQFRGIEFPENNKILAGISGELSNRVMVFATDNRLKAAFTNDDRMIRWEDLESHNIITRIPEDKLDQWDEAITLMLTQLIRTLERWPDKYSGGKCPPPALLLDVFPRLGKIDVIQNAVSTLRSKGVTICVIVQSLAQLDKIYGKESRSVSTFLKVAVTGGFPTKGRNFPMRKNTPVSVEPNTPAEIKTRIPGTPTLTVKRNVKNNWRR